ncbi:MAG: nitroreductase family protein, partial [Mycobacterium sp.]
MTGSSPDVPTLEGVLETAAHAPSAGNAQPWRWQVGRAGVALYADWDRQLGSTQADRRDVLLSCGAVLDHCVVALAAKGWRPTVRRLPVVQDGADLALIEMVEQPAGPASVELEAAIGRRRTDRRRYSERAIPAGTLEM